MDFNELVSKGFDFFQEGKIGPALENLESALKLQPHHAGVQQMINFISQFVQTCVNEAKHRAEVMKNLYGIKLENPADVDKIITEYNHNPDHASAKEILALAYYIRGLLSESKGEPARAAEDYSDAIKNQPDYPSAFGKRGSVNQKTGNYDQAIEDFQKANFDEAQLKQSLAGAYMARGIEYDKKNDYAHAAQDYAKALEFQPDNSTARELLDMAKAQM